MAQPIPLQLPPRDPRVELQKRLDEAPIAHAEALLDSFDLLQKMHDHGVFDLLRGTIQATDHIVGAAAEAADTDQSVRAMRNAIILGKMLAAINPEVLQSIANAAGETLDCFDKPTVEPPGLFSLLSQFRHKELRRSIAFISRFLKSLGNQIKIKAHKDPESKH